jgi:hypothetical protein
MRLLFREQLPFPQRFYLLLIVRGLKMTAGSAKKSESLVGCQHPMEKTANRMTSISH